MRIAFVSFETVHHRATETNARLEGIIDLLRERGHEVHVCCARFWTGKTDVVERDGVTYHGVSVGLEAPGTFYTRLPFVLQRIGPDVIHAAAEPPGQVLAANWGSSLARVPLLVEWYGAGGVPDTRLHRWATSRPDRIVTPSRLVRTWVRERGAAEEQVQVIPNHVDTERIREIDPGDPVDVVYARHLDAAANVESLLLALAELRRRNWTATIVGDGPERETYEELASDLRITDKVDFVGECSRDERIAIYRGAHVFAQTARRCVFPTEMLWALAAGCVGIVEYHADSSAHELIEGRSRSFRTTSEDELTDAIVRAGELERRTYDERYEEFGRRPILERYLQLYRDLQVEYGLL